MPPSTTSATPAYLIFASKSTTSISITFKFHATSALPDRHLTCFLNRFRILKTALTRPTGITFNQASSSNVKMIAKSALAVAATALLFGMATSADLAADACASLSSDGHMPHELNGTCTLTATATATLTVTATTTSATPCTTETDYVATQTVGPVAPPIVVDPNSTATAVAVSVSVSVSTTTATSMITKTSTLLDGTQTVTKTETATAIPSGSTSDIFVPGTPFTVPSVSTTFITSTSATTPSADAGATDTPSVTPVDQGSSTTDAGAAATSAPSIAAAVAVGIPVNNIMAAVVFGCVALIMPIVV